MTGASPPNRRIVSLDQFRGYTVAGMLLVNFLNSYHVIPAILRHHNTYCSYADTIMPQFFFAVGFAFRLTHLRRLANAGMAAAYRHAVARNLGLILLGVVVYHLDGDFKSWDELRRLGWRGFVATAFQRDVFQTLVHIALASLWVLPVIGARPSIRVGYLLASGILHLALSRWFYFEWAWNRPVIDGGPLGFMTWSIPLLVGSLAYDAIVALGPARSLRPLATWSLALMALGYSLSFVGAGALVAPPFLPGTRPVDLWTMSQRTGSVSYLSFATGFSLAVFAAFVWVCDVGTMRVGMFRTFGQNALAAYLIHPVVSEAVRPFVPRDAPLWFVLGGFALYFAISYLFVRHLEKTEVFLRL